eukprot:10126730-Ditylum_brightwellii.AAC.1
MLLLLEEDVQMLPCTMDAHMHKGGAMQWFRHGKHNQKIDLTPYNFFGIQDDHLQGCQMCCTTMTDQWYCGYYRQATQEWLRQHSHQQFRPTYQDSTSSSWADIFLACAYQQAFTQHILNCI